MVVNDLHKDVIEVETAIKGESSLLYLVATPIGNRDDMSLRAIEVLRSVDCIAAEDTRHSQRLLQYHGIKTPLISLHEHNEDQRIKSLLDRLLGGECIALISDAGTPLISDPGYRLVTAMHDANIRVVPIPGACALIAALAASGLPTDRFVFEGFLPFKQTARQKKLRVLLEEERTIVFYESTHRIVNCMEDVLAVFGEKRLATMARELTKTFETVHRAPLSELVAWMKSDANQQKGEFVVVVEGKKTVDLDSNQKEHHRVLSILLEEIPLKQAVALATRLCGTNRKSLYKLALEIKDSAAPP